jgi:ribosomal protein L36
MASCLTCDKLRVYGSLCDGTGRVFVYCADDPRHKKYPTMLMWKGLAPELREACEDHVRRCDQCGRPLEGLAASRSSFCSECKKLRRKVSMGMLPVEALLV